MVQALPFALGNICNLIYFRLDMKLLSKLIPDVREAQSTNAWYGLAFTIVNAFTILPGAYMGAVFPVMSRAFERKPVQFRYIYTDAVRWMVILGIPFAVGLGLISEPVAEQFFPKLEWAQIAPALGLLSIAGGLAFLTTVMVTVLRAADKRVAFSTLMLITMGANLGLNLMLIPHYQHVGAAIAMIASEALLLLLCLIYIRRSISRLEYIGFIWKALIVTTVMGVGLSFTPSISIWIRVLAAAGFYFGLMWIWGELRPFKVTTNDYV